MACSQNTILFLLGKHMKLSPEAEEVATFFAKMLDHEYTTKDIFRKNFFKDWRKVAKQNFSHYKCQNFISWRWKILQGPMFCSCRK